MILGGVDTQTFSPDPAAARIDRPLFVGRILPHKGVADLVNALPDGMTLDVIGPPTRPAPSNRCSGCRMARGSGSGTTRTTGRL